MVEERDLKSITPKIQTPFKKTHHHTDFALIYSMIEDKKISVTITINFKKSSACTNKK